MEDLDTELLFGQYRDAIALANRAKQVLDRSATLSSAKAKDALRAWDTATQNAIRLQRLLRQAGVAPKSLDDELHDLVGQ